MQVLTEDGTMTQKDTDLSMRTFLIILILPILMGSTFLFEEEEKFRLNVDSFLLIKGSSNINKFECTVDGSSLKDTIDIVYKPNGSSLDFHRFRIDIPVTQFDCQNSMITSDFKETLKAEEYPHMMIDFVKLLFPENDDPFEDIYPTGIFARVTLTGKKKKYYIGLEKESLEEKTVRLKGNLAVDMRDFDLEPPTKMLSLVRVNPLLDINFNLSMTRLESEIK